MLRRALVAMALIFSAQIGAVGPAESGATRAAELVQFRDEQQIKELAKDGPTVVFFYATWCPNCKAAALEFSTKWNEVRPGLALVVADYDKQTALKAKYGVTYQDTYVLVDADGAKRKIWNGGGLLGLNANTAE